MLMQVAEEQCRQCLVAVSCRDCRGKAPRLVRVAQMIILTHASTKRVSEKKSTDSCCMLTHPKVDSQSEAKS